MDADLLDLARTVDLTVLGARVKTARLARRLTQTEVAGGEMSTAYVSRIESGQRRPDPDLLEVIASRVGVGVDELVLGTTRDTITEARLALVSAEVEIRTGDAHAALRRVDETLMDLAGQGQQGLQRETLRLKAAALEATGRLDEAIIMLEDLTESAEPDTLWVTDMMRLCRCYRTSGDLARAVEVGEHGLNVLKEYELLGTYEGVSLALSLAAAYHESGKLGMAIRLSHRTIEQARTVATPGALGAAFWNASIMESRRGKADAALALARKASVYIEMGDNHRQQALLHSELGILQLRVETPSAAAALDDLRRAATELAASDAGPDAIAANKVAQARALVMLGHHGEAAELLDDMVGAGISPHAIADALVLRGQVQASSLDVASALDSYRQAVHTLTGIGADNKTAQLWYELGTLFEEAGEATLAMQAFRRAGASVGLVGVNSRLGLHVDTSAPAMATHAMDA